MSSVNPTVTAPIAHRSGFSSLLRALRYVRPLKFRFAVEIALTLLSLFPTLFLPWPTKLVIDYVIGGKPLRGSEQGFPFFFRPFVHALTDASPERIVVNIALLGLAMVVLFGAWGTNRQNLASQTAEGADTATESENLANKAWSGAGGVFGCIEYGWTLRTSQLLNHHYRSQLYERIQRLPMSALDDQRIGDAIYRLMYDTPAITMACYYSVISIIAKPLSALAAIWLIWLVYGDQPLILWVSGLMVPTIMLVTLPFSGMLRRRATLTRRMGATATTSMEESDANVLAVQSLGGSKREATRFGADSWRSYGSFRSLALSIYGITAVAGLVGLVLGMLVIYKLTDQVFAKALSAGDFYAILALFVTAATHAGEFGGMWATLQGHIAGVERVFELMDAPSDAQPVTPQPLPIVTHGYAFEDVHFAYPDGTQSLRGVTFDAKLGQLLALAGPAGAGKTTLAYMFPRFFAPTSGRITLDGMDLNAIDRDQLRNQVAFVFQEPVLFNATVAENIRVGRPNASAEDVRHAAVLAGAAEFIEHLPLGYDTPLGRSGGRLSVGQKQRLAIARALVRNAKVLILDEPTAALDPETEMRLMHTLDELRHDKLVIVIAHRLSTIRRADHIAFIDEGRIVERGDHETLMAIPKGRYRRFVELQVGETKRHQR